MDLGMCMNNTLTALKGVKVGHSTHTDRLTGCTVVLFDSLYKVAYKSYGGAAETFNTESLREGRPWSLRRGLFISGGSLPGLGAASEIMDFMTKNGMGEKYGNNTIPSISGAAIYDLGVQMAQYDPKYGREAAGNANTAPVEGGNAGAGTGASVGKFSYTVDNLALAMKSGVGSARFDFSNGVTVCAMSVVNALGNIILPSGAILAGNRNDRPSPKFRTFESLTSWISASPQNTTISVVGTNVDLGDYSNYEAVAHMASQGQTRAISPVNTSLDGDTVFVFSTRETKYILSPFGTDVADALGWHSLHVDALGQAAANVVQESIYDACRQAETVSYDKAFEKRIPSLRDLP